MRAKSCRLIAVLMSWSDGHDDPADLRAGSREVAYDRSYCFSMPRGRRLREGRPLQLAELTHRELRWLRVGTVISTGQRCSTKQAPGGSSEQGVRPDAYCATCFLRSATSRSPIEESFAPKRAVT